MYKTMRRFAAMAMAACALAAATVTPASAQYTNAVWHRNSAIEYGPLAGTANQDKGYWLFNHGYPNAASLISNTSWNAADFTGAWGIPLAATTQVTRGYGYGATAFHRANGIGAYWMNSYGDPSENEHGAPMPNSDTKIDAAFGGGVDNVINNWAQSPQAKVCLSTKYRMTNYYGEWDKAIQSYWSVFLFDTTTQQSINFTIKMWANRNEGLAEGAGFSEIGPYVYSYVGDTATYTTKESGRNAIIGEVPTAQVMGQENWFHACITHDNLARVINTYNQYVTRTGTGQPLSPNRNGYQLRGVFNQTEMMKLRWYSDAVGPYYPGTQILGPYNPNARSQVGVTWWDHAVVTVW